MEIAAVVPALRDDFTVEPLFVRERIGAPLRWTGALPATLAARLERVAGRAPCTTCWPARSSSREQSVAEPRSPRSRWVCCCALLAGHLAGRSRSSSGAGRAGPARRGRRSSGWRRPGSRCRPRQFVLGSAAVGAVCVRRRVLRHRHRAGRRRARGRGGIDPAGVLRASPRGADARAPARVARRVARPGGVDRRRALAHPRAHDARRDRPAPLRVAFARFPTLSRMLGTVPALEVLEAELADPTSDRVIEVLILAYERGGPIVKQILEDLVVSTTKDVKVLEEIESEGLEMKINARAVLVMPWFVLLALTLRPGPFRDFYRSPAGLLVVLVGAALSGLGSWWISRLGRAHQEQRVFGALPPAEVGSMTGTALGAGLRLGWCRRGRRGRRGRAADPTAGAPRPPVHGVHARAAGSGSRRARTSIAGRRAHVDGEPPLRSAVARTRAASRPDLRTSERCRRWRSSCTTRAIPT